ncbi:hypothetical protein BZG00_15360 [Salinivibrio kushneri]|uniref:Bacteriophage T5 Orf172 DNA-binding domain-containing protein n=2 Tax=Pseudomonadota TaxID=1224 RepID=A0A922NY69_9HYPH|nr:MULTISPECIES: GIY-YIG nuclease family protein [Pseudomonadota]YP_008125997.1 GIY-YIG nuclease family protein [Alteromonas phage vB_AmaP_AD45-P1]AGM46963.1 hypothetical protein AD45P3_00125 [Alteromonas phage vB_AmaP_AD45-P3]AGM47080.1 hypothetical protein AD45P4_00125 [Alteromonas phage vB_AmaP_AD45-P4]AGM47196.1 hypothetical protein AD45P2_00125 [Alteromonas phage vB_AmaP_AD45-P2]AGM46844.1 hypothetical protein AD45P1_00130 [Alteromonas phage vB_AmaP_AD45-P1]KEQ05565.1 hypothetical protei
MIKLRVNSKNTEKPLPEDGILYILFFRMEDKELVKIGVTSRDDIEIRVSEILVSIFKKYREFPYCRPKRFRKTEKVFEKERFLHKYFEKRRYTTAKKFSGSTEFFEVPLDEVVQVYEDLLEGKIGCEG